MLSFVLVVTLQPNEGAWYHLTPLAILAPPLLWLALRGDTLAAVSAPAVTALAIVAGTVSGVGPFSEVVRGEPANLYAAQAALTTASLGSLAVHFLLLELRSSNAELTSLLTRAPLGLAFFDDEYRYLRINDELALINGIPAPEHLGRTISDLLPVNAVSVRPVIDEVFASGRIFRDLEIVGETPLKPGQERYWLTGFFPVKGSDGSVRSCGAWVVEVTDLKRTEQALIEANRAKDTLLYEVNHRIKNSLQLVVSLLTLQTRGVRDEVARLALKNAEQRIGVIARIHQKLYSLGSHDHVDFTAFVGEIASDMTDSLIGDREIRLVVDAEPGIVLPIDQAVPMALAVSELLTNAIKHGANSTDLTTVGVTLSRSADGIRIRVSDDGVGLPAGFDIAKAPGLGMKIVTSLVKQARSTLTVANHAPGTAFTILIPKSEV